MAHFPHFWDNFLFTKKSGPVTHSNTGTSKTMLIFRKKLMSQSQKNFRTKTQDTP